MTSTTTTEEPTMTVSLTKTRTDDQAILDEEWGPQVANRYPEIRAVVDSNYSPFEPLGKINTRVELSGWIFGRRMGPGYRVSPLPLTAHGSARRLPRR